MGFDMRCLLPIMVHPSGPNKKSLQTIVPLESTMVIVPSFDNWGLALAWVSPLAWACACAKTVYEKLSACSLRTPLRISNAQSASPRSHEVGVLNVQRCNLRWAGL